MEVWQQTSHFQLALVDEKSELNDTKNKEFIFLKQLVIYCCKFYFFFLVKALSQVILIVSGILCVLAGSDKHSLGL